MSFTLHPYQHAGIDAIRQAMRAGHRRILAVCPVGGGKTVVFSSILAATAAKGGTGLVLVHREELLDQASDKLTRWGVPHGVIKAGRKADSRWPVQVASVQSLLRRTMPPAQLVVIDEAHRTMATSYRVLLDRLPHARILGFTATPYRTDGRGLGDVFTELVEIATPSQLLELGILVPPRVFAPSAPDLAGVRTTAGDYNQKDLVLRVDTPRLIGSVAEHWGRLVRGRLAVAFAASIEHSRHLVSALQGVGARAAHLDAQTDPDVRRATLEQLARGEIEVISNVGLITEGWDLPQLGAVIVARPTQSASLWIQMCGRGARAHEGKTDYLLVDHAGNVQRHGFPDDDRLHSLETATRRLRPVPSLRTCSLCFMVVPASVATCPDCQQPLAVPQERERTPESVSGELVELQDRPQRPPSPSVQQRQLDYLRWRAEAWINGWKPGYASHRYHEKYGIWPVKMITGAWDEARALELVAEFDLIPRRVQLGRLREARMPSGEALP